MSISEGGDARAHFQDVVAPLDAVCWPPPFAEVTKSARLRAAINPSQGYSTGLIQHLTCGWPEGLPRLVLAALQPRPARTAAVSGAPGHCDRTL